MSLPIQLRAREEYCRRKGLDVQVRRVAGIRGLVGLTGFALSNPGLRVLGGSSTNL
jgi:hypothetical protein